MTKILKPRKRRPVAQPVPQQVKPQPQPQQARSGRN